MNWKYLFNIIAFKCWTGLFRSVGNFIQIYCGSLSRNTVTTKEYQWTENICWVSYHSDVEQTFSEVCEISYKFILATSHQTLSLHMTVSELKIFVEYHSIQMLNRSFYSESVSEVCDISNKFIEATCLETLSLLKSINELKIFVEYHSIQMLNRSFYSGPVSEVCEISNKFIEATCFKTLSLLKSISELKIFVECHSIQMLNRSFHLGLISANIFGRLLIKHFHY